MGWIVDKFKLRTNYRGVEEFNVKCAGNEMTEAEFRAWEKRAGVSIPADKTFKYVDGKRVTAYKAKRIKLPSGGSRRSGKPTLAEVASDNYRIPKIKYKECNDYKKIKKIKIKKYYD